MAERPRRHVDKSPTLAQNRVGDAPPVARLHVLDARLHSAPILRHSPEQWSKGTLEQPRHAPLLHALLLHANAGSIVGTEPHGSLATPRKSRTARRERRHPPPGRRRRVRPHASRHVGALRPRPRRQLPPAEG